MIYQPLRTISMWTVFPTITLNGQNGFSASTVRATKNAAKWLRSFMGGGMTLHLITTNEIKKHGHYLARLLLSESQDVTMRKVASSIMVKCPDGSYVEIFPHEYEALKHHKIIWEEGK